MTLRQLLLALACAAQLAVAGGSVWRAESALAGAPYRFETMPVDPVDWFRGRYVRINFPRESLVRADDVPLEVGGTAFATLETGDDGLSHFEAVYGEAPEGVDTVPVEVLHASRHKATVRLGFDRFYLEEERAPEMEAAIRELRGRAIAVVRVRGDQAVLEDLELDRTAPELAPLRERLRMPHDTPLPESLLAALKEPPFLDFQRCGTETVCAVFAVELDGQPGSEYVVEDANGRLHYYIPTPKAASGYVWRAALQPRRGGRRPFGADLLARIEEDPDAVTATDPDFRDLRIGDLTFLVPH